MCLSTHLPYNENYGDPIGQNTISVIKGAFPIKKLQLRTDTHFADIHGFMNVALVGAIPWTALAVLGLNCTDESDVHKTMNISKVSVNPYININLLFYLTTYYCLKPPTSVEN